ncbi:MAG: class I SAM-dependent methyltransferase [Trichlorobacter sp.]|nr:class I SAM-dependent methyltransferase [Trichlorobacter sp.]
MEKRRDFDAKAANWDEKPRRVKLAQEVALAMQQLLPFDKNWQAMDLGCGTGLLTMHLAPLVQHMAAVDSSLEMLKQLQQKAAVAGYDNITTFHYNLEQDKLPDDRFNLISSSMLLHHIPDVPKLVKRLYQYLLPGGWLAFADLEAEDGSFHDDPTGICHHGFSQQEMGGFLHDAGCQQVKVIKAAEVVKGERRYPVLLGIGKRMD